MADTENTKPKVSVTERYHVLDLAIRTHAGSSGGGSREEILETAQQYVDFAYTDEKTVPELGFNKATGEPLS